MEIAPGLYSLWQRKGANVHAFLLDDGKDLTLIDTLYDRGRQTHPGSDRGDWEDGQGSQTDHHDARSPLALGGLSLLKGLGGARVYAHEWEADLISGDRAAQQVSWLPHSPVRTWPLQVANNLGFIRHPPARVDEFIHDRGPGRSCAGRIRARAFSGPPGFLLA